MPPRLFSRLFPRLLRRPGDPNILDITGAPTWHTPAFRMQACNARDQVACTAAALGWNAFETPMPHYFAQAVQAAGQGLVIDVGANTGFYTLLALAVSRDITVAAYEPLDTVRDILRQNLALNPTGRRARVHAQAASDSTGPRDLFIPDASHGLVETSASLSGTFKGAGSQARTVSVTTLDARHRGNPPVRVIKIDAESHDLAVLRGAETILRRDRPVVFVEVLLGADEDGLTALLESCAYQDCVLRPDGATALASSVRHDPFGWNHMWVPRQ